MNSCRLYLLLILGLLLSMHIWGTDPPPEFSAAGAVRGVGTVKLLVPGVHMSIYGEHLGPPGRSLLLKLLTDLTERLRTCRGSGFSGDQRYFTT